MGIIPNTTAIILAGGQSSRMGQDKGLMEVKGKPMIQHIIDTVSLLTNQIIIIANNTEYQQFGFPVYEDFIKQKGPLAGIVTGLSNSTTDLNWIISCDVPFVSANLLSELMLNLVKVDVVVPSKNDRIHPLIGGYKKSTLQIFKRELEHNHLKIMNVISYFDVHIMNADQFDVINFKNLNSKEDI
jgi:molybdopterin-guanine dinucleotide biosynthesis protein A